MIPFNRTIGLTMGGSIRLTGSGGETIGGVKYKGSSGVLFGAHIGLVVFIGR